MNNQVLGSIILERETVSYDAKLIKEVNGKVEATGIVQDTDEENRNGRIYPTEDLKAEIYGDRIQKELIPTQNMKGEAGHPCTSELSRQSVVDIKLTNVLFTKIWMEGRDVHANFRGTNNDLGRAFNADLLDGAKPSFSLRALGSVDRDKSGKCYVRNIRIITYDNVIFPSHKRAYTTGFVTRENKSINEAAYVKFGATTNYVDTNCGYVRENGLLIPVVNKQCVDYIKNESANLKSLSNSFEVEYGSAIIVEGGKKVMLTLPTGDKMIINLEQYIADEIRNYCYNK